ALAWDEVDFKERVIRLPPHRVKPGRAPMMDFVHGLLVARRRLGDAHYVFPAHSRSGHIEEARVWLAAVREITGIEFSTHDLRRPFITVAESCDISVYALKALVNHSLGSTVTENYIAMTPARLRAPAQKVCDELKLLCGVNTEAGTNITTLARVKF